VTELAVVCPVVLSMLLGTLDFAQVMYAHGTVAEAARAGARYAIVHGSRSSSPVGPSANDSTVQSVVKSYALALNPSRLNVTSSWGNGNNDASSTVTVTATYTCYLSIAKLVGLSTVTVKGTTTMRITN
jgi:Flp pilus assembly protein TadG